MESIKVKNFELIEIETKTGLPVYRLPTQTVFAGKEIIAIETFYVSTIPLAPSGMPLANINTIKSAFLTLNVKGVEKIKNLPIVNLVDPMNLNNKFQIDNLIISSDKCEIHLADPSVAVTGEVILLGIYYKD